MNDHNIVTRICFAIPSLGVGGMERVMSEIICAFSKKENIEMHLILFGRKREIFYNLPDKVIVHKPSFVFSNKFRTFNTIRTILYIRSTIKNLNPHSILSFGDYWNSLVLLSCIGLGMRIYVSDRSKPVIEKGTFQNWLKIKLYPHAKGVIAQTQKAKDNYLKIYHHDNMKVIGNPIKNINCEKGYRERENIVISVGRLATNKHYDRLIRLFSKINLPGWKLVIVGGDVAGGDNFAKLNELICNMNLQEKVFLAGTQKNVDEWLFRSSIFAFCSSSEGFPNVIGEAMQAELPVVSYDCLAGPSEMIEDGLNGYLIPVFDDDLFREKLMYLMRNKTERAKMGKYAKQSIKNFDSDMICNKFYEFIVNNK